MSISIAYRSRSSDGFERYARTTLLLKLQEPTAAALSQCQDALAAAYSRVYRGVVLDIDGTLTDEGSSEVSPSVARQVARLLRGAVPVILATGRGGSAREAVLDILRLANLDRRYLSRLYVLGYHGAILLSQDPRFPSEVLPVERELSRRVEDDGPLFATVDRVLSTLGLSSVAQQRITRYALRIGLADEHVALALRNALHAELVAAGQESNTFVSVGRYGASVSVDVGTSDKWRSLEVLLDELGIPAGAVACVGDQGAEGGMTLVFWIASEASA